MTVQKWTTAILVTAWGVGMVGAFWAVEGRYLRPVARPTGAADLQPENLPQSPLPTLATEGGPLRLSGRSPVTLLNFWNPDCACSRFAESDVRHLMARFQNVRVVTVVESGASPSERIQALTAWHGRNLPVSAISVDPGSTTARAFGVWAAPAAVILDRDGRVAYVGAYNAARFCSNPKTAWAAQALERVTSGQNPIHAKTPFFGCQVIARGVR